MLPRCSLGQFCEFSSLSSGRLEDAWEAEKRTGGGGRKMLKAMNEHAFSKPKLCEPGRLLINLGFVENMAFRLRQKKKRKKKKEEGATPLWPVLAKEGLVAGNNGFLLVPLPLPGEHIPPPTWWNGGGFSGSEVTPCSFQCLGTGIVRVRVSHSCITGDEETAFLECEHWRFLPQQHG